MIISLIAIKRRQCSHFTGNLSGIQSFILKVSEPSLRGVDLVPNYRMAVPELVLDVVRETADDIGVIRRG